MAAEEERKEWYNTPGRGRERETACTSHEACVMPAHLFPLARGKRTCMRWYLSNSTRWIHQSWRRWKKTQCLRIDFPRQDFRDQDENKFVYELISVYFKCPQIARQMGSTSLKGFRQSKLIVKTEGGIEFWETLISVSFPADLWQWEKGNTSLHLTKSESRT